MMPLTDERQHRLAARALADQQAKLADDIARLNAIRTEFYTTAAAARDRLNDAWTAVEVQQKRAAEEWAEANRYFTAQTASLDARAAELARHERESASRRASAEAETAGLREEATSLETRVYNSRLALAMLEQRRERLRAEWSGTESSANLSVAMESGELAERERQLARDRAAVANLRAILIRESEDVDDRRRLVAEQLAMLAEARAQWQRIEHQTVLEMEELARDLRQRELELDAREQRLIQADVRRRSEAYDLWQLRLRLEAWQAKLTACEVRCNAERDWMAADERATTAPSAELLALRDEVERLAVTILEMKLPEPLEPPEHELPWAIEQPEALTYSDARAA